MVSSVLKLKFLEEMKRVVNAKTPQVPANVCGFLEGCLVIFSLGT